MSSTAVRKQGSGAPNDGPGKSSSAQNIRIDGAIDACTSKAGIVDVALAQTKLQANREAPHEVFTGRVRGICSIVPSA
jgi:hypothetical protein